MPRREDAIYTPEGSPIVSSLPPIGVLQPRLDAVAAGEWTDIEWPWPVMSERSKSLLPGTITVLCGSPGATKSLLLLDACHRWMRRGVGVAMMALEGGPELHLMRLLAMLAGTWDVMSDKWGKAHAAELQKHYDEFAGEIDIFAKCLFSAPAGTLLYARLLAWLKEQLELGCKIVAIDPITYVDVGTARDIEDRRFIAEAERLVVRHQARLILVSHPRGKIGPNPDIDDIAGGRGFGRHTQTVLWFSRAEKRVQIEKFCGLIEVDVNRIMHILKSTNGAGQGDQIGFILDQHVQFSEQGRIIKQSKKWDEQ